MDLPCCIRFTLRSAHTKLYIRYPLSRRTLFRKEEPIESICLRRVVFVSLGEHCTHAHTLKRETPLSSSYSHPHKSNRCEIDLQLHFPHTRPQICIIQHIDSCYLLFQICRSAVRSVSLPRFALSNDKESIIRTFHFNFLFPSFPLITFAMLLFSAIFHPSAWHTRAMTLFAPPSPGEKLLNNRRTQ